MLAASTRAFLSVCLALAPVQAWAFQRERLVVLLHPGEDGAPVNGLTRGASEVLATKGYDVLAGSKVDAFARAQGIGSLQRLSSQRAATLLQQYRADGLLLIRVTFFLPERERSVGPRATAAMGVVAELRGRDGRVTWRGTASAYADDRALEGESSTVDTLVSLACERVLWSLPRAPPDPKLVAIAEAQKKKRAEQNAPTWVPRPPPEPDKAEALLKREPSFRENNPRFKLRIGRTPRIKEGDRAPSPAPPGPTHP